MMFQSVLFRVAFFVFLLCPAFLVHAQFDQPIESEEPETKTMAEGAIEPYDLRVEYMDSPQGIDVAAPLFSWKLDSDEPGQAPSAYRIVVYRTERTSATISRPVETVWDSGKVLSNSLSALYQGAILKPRTEYIWTLTVWDKETTLPDEDSVTASRTTPFVSGRPSSAQTSAFSTGLFETPSEPSPWKGDWIGLDAVELEPNQAEEKTLPDLAAASWIWNSKEAVHQAAVGPCVLRKSFELSDKVAVASASLFLAADDGYSASLNGERVARGSTFKFANRTDVTSVLKSGKNLLAVEVTNHGEAPNPAGLLGILDIQLENGQKQVFVTDSTWKIVQGSPEGALLPEHDDSGWANATVIAKPGQGPWGEVKLGETRPSPPARYLMRSFAPKKNVFRATASIAGLGYYELYLNGEKVGDHLLDPVLTDYDKQIPYVTYDIPADQLNVNSDRKDNQIEIRLGNGRFYSPRENARSFGFPKLLFQLELQYADGETELIVSDENWFLSTNGPIRDNNDYDGEIYDARRNVQWTEKARKVEAPKGKLTAQMMPPMRVVEEREPQSITEVKPGVWIFDFGVNLVGNCTIKLPEGLTEGTKLQLKHAEMIQKEGPDKGMLYMDNLREALCRDIYIANGKEQESDEYTPSFTYHGFRFVELTGLPAGIKPTPSTLTARVINTDLPRVGYFETNHQTVNAIFNNIVRGTQGNYLSIPTDCPQRDERHGWQGDRAAESKGEMYIFDNITLYRKWLRDIRDSQREDGNVSDVCPNYWPLYHPNVTWPSAQVIIPDSLHVMYAETRPMTQQYDCARGWLIDYLGNFVKDGIIEVDNYGDWCVPPEKPELIHSMDPARKTAKGVISTAYYIHNLDLMTRYAQFLKNEADVELFQAKAEEMRKAFNNRFYDKERGQYDNGTQTSCVLPLRFGIVPQGDEEKVFNTLLRNIKEVTHNHIGTGLIGGQWLNRVLSDFGRPDLAWIFATNIDYPSWGYMVEQGATTIWELWNGDTADPAMNSANHVMLVGDLGIWFFEYLAGIKPDPDRPGFEHIIMKPVPVKGLTYVEAEYESIRGTITSNWRCEDGQFSWEIGIPVGSTATAVLPDGTVRKNLGSGNHEFNIPWSPKK